MDFDDHDDGDEEEMAPMPVSSSYDAPPLAAGGFGAPAPPKPPGERAKAPGGRYRECLKNHAVGIGGHAVDGCGEFMPAGEEGTLDALRCAACGCHRNFHRKESPEGSPAALVAYGGGAATPHHHHFSPYYRTPAGSYFHHHHQQQQPIHMAAAGHHTPRPLALPSTSHSWRDDGDDYLSGGMAAAGPVSALGPLGLGGGAGPSGSGGSGKKRFRTKFTQEQKDRMLAFAERVGWRIQKHDEAAVQQFCDEVCVKRHVLKVWMHNNKHTLGKKP
ncbi:ZF-HD protein dimerisation region containing protein [Zea mays]|jgi:ZF-HD class homeobox domain-containing protein|uniref:ZF-HD protein dimerisation region containing protein n=1 Tax=Zea mays TaxID=4577 RepID=B6U5Z0_MAIZE|nr:ZF-HD protein dimerisation region containing protein [Zea mays]ACG44773.1 ZF-HD protein dimerisation region containing protein [Zea mays]ONM55566.1 Zinc-finger homeodomain protein 2 [Zea mays]|eukprot:NP_001151888.1 ZF-HD protein dimerisation region containing protein [Zea mays]